MGKDQRDQGRIVMRSETKGVSFGLFVRVFDYGNAKIMANRKSKLPSQVAPRPDSIIRKGRFGQAVSTLRFGQASMPEGHCFGQFFRMIKHEVMLAVREYDQLLVGGKFREVPVFGPQGGIGFAP
jgi:hypothetical protein